MSAIDRDALTAVVRDALLAAGADGHTTALAKVAVTDAVLAHLSARPATDHDAPRLGTAVNEFTGHSLGITDAERVEARDALDAAHDRDEVNRLARLLIASWEQVDSRPVGVTYVATFADLARVALAARPAPDTLADHVQALDGESLIAAERRRQVEEEGYTPEHDDAHGWQVLYQAAMHYLREEGYAWPWAPGACKPTDVVRDTIKAGALAQAAIEVAERAGVPPYMYAAAKGVRAQCAGVLDDMFTGLRALLAGRSDASPEGGA